MWTSVSVLFAVVPDTSLAVYRRIVEPENLKVGVTAHIGGFMAGTVVCVCMCVCVYVHVWWHVHLCVCVCVGVVCRCSGTCTHLLCVGVAHALMCFCVCVDECVGVVACALMYV